MDSTPSSPTPSRPGTPLAELPDIPNAAPRPFRFTWDPTASRRQGPGSVSATTEGRGDYFGQLPRLDLFGNGAGNLGSSLNGAGAQGGLPREWSSSTQGFHAISTVLNNPHKSQAPPKAHSSLPAVPHADLPRVRRKDFDSYLRALGPEWAQFERNSTLGKEGVAQLDGPMSPRRPSLLLDETHNDGSRTPRPSTSLPGRSIPELSTVPEVFFEDDFDLGNPQTFALVTGQSPSSSASSSSLSDPASLSHSLPLLEKFSHYADTVEQHLVREISLRSTSFFAALTNLNDLQAESSACLLRTSTLRGLLQDVDDKGAKKGLHVIRRECRLRNLGKVKDGVEAIEGVVKMTSVARELVENRQWDDALDRVEEMQNLWNTTPSQAQAGDANTTQSGIDSITEEEDQPTSTSARPRMPISSLHAFSALPTHLLALTTEITSSLTTELVDLLEVDLLERIDLERPLSEKSAEQSSPVLRSSPQIDGLNTKLRDRVRPLLGSLSRTEGVKECLGKWREKSVGLMRVVILELLPMYKSFDASSEEQSTSTESSVDLRAHIHGLPFPEFLSVVQRLYNNFLNGIEGIKAQNEILVAVLQEMMHGAPDQSSIDVQALEDDLSETLSSIGELTNTQAGHIVNLRFSSPSKPKDKDTSTFPTPLTLPQFWTLHNASWSFVVSCEVLCRRMILGLRGIIVSQSKSFLQKFHQERIETSAKLVEEEVWVPVDVPAGSKGQRGVEIIVEGAVRDAEELKFNGKTMEAQQAISTSEAVPPAIASSSSGSASLPSGSKSPSSEKPTSSATGTKHLLIESHPYFAVEATLEVILIVQSYLQIIVNLPSLTTETMSRIIEFLKAFNSRTCQVVLGAGAMRSAGLKNITAKHLALASQSLSIMTALIPYIREAFRRHLNSKQAVMLVEFDKLKRDYQEHQNEIHSKLIAIMGDRLSAHIKTLQAVDWSLEQFPAVNDYMVLLMKETVMLHKVLTRYLSQPVVEYVMTQVFAAITHRLSEEYSGIPLPHQAAKNRLLADAQFLHQKLSTLKGVNLQSSMLEMIISENKVQSSNPSLPSAGSTSSLTSQPSTSTMASVVQRASTITSANSRLKGLLSRSSDNTATVESKPLPTPSPPPGGHHSPSPIPIIHASPTPPPPDSARGASPPLPAKSPPPRSSLGGISINSASARSSVESASMGGGSGLSPTAASTPEPGQGSFKGQGIPVVGPRRSSSYVFREVTAPLSPIPGDRSSSMTNGDVHRAAGGSGSAPSSRPTSPRPPPKDSESSEVGKSEGRLGGLGEMQVNGHGVPLKEGES